MCRREGVSLCGKERCAVKRRNYPPGVHGQGRRPRLTAYGIQLREKQKAKRFYNVMEKQFRNYFKKASQSTGNTGEVLVRLLEERLDNVVYRLGFGKTRRQARQLINHGFFEINGKKVDIPSYQVKVGDVITIKGAKTEKGIFQDLNDRLAKHEAPGWLHMDAGSQTGKITSHPEDNDLKQIFDPKLIVEFYSR
jgi:small subunit ribosomal protein S4